MFHSPFFHSSSRGREVLQILRPILNRPIMKTATKIFTKVPCSHGLPNRKYPLIAPSITNAIVITIPRIQKVRFKRKTPTTEIISRTPIRINPVATIRTVVSVAMTVESAFFPWPKSTLPPTPQASPRRIIRIEAIRVDWGIFILSVSLFSCKFNDKCSSPAIPKKAFLPGSLWTFWKMYANPFFPPLNLLQFTKLKGFYQGKITRGAHIYRSEKRIYSTCSDEEATWNEW